ncbi:signal peptidase I [Mesobacillus foraminis]|uniref:signal peptidase I n=1 Tax=Mesobacillus foraminis TaxID=279826 RepID=UPI001BE7F7C7|nr:signal peptidase I [Mesobacillus foraminis]MBT2758394.1 signal peptidase I [Mesobacillus foraminis]
MLFDQATVELFKSTIQKEGYIILPSMGNSMYPLIRQGNLCRFVSCEPEELKKGDVVLYYSEMGQIIAHRFIEMKSTNYMSYYYLKGDTNLGFDAPIKEHQIVGKLVSIQKGDRNVHSGGIALDLWGKLVIAIPPLSGILRKYLNWKTHYQF